MKRISLWLTTTAFCALLTGSAPAQNRIGTIDLRKVFDKYWRTIQADANLKDQAADMDKEHKGFVDDLTKAKEDYQKLLGSASDQAVSTEERDKRKAAAEKKLLDIRELEQTIQQYERQARSTLDEKKRRMRENILKEIREVVTTKARSAGYAMVIDSAGETANGTPILLYNNNDNDLTEPVLLQINANAPPEPPAPAPKPAEKPAEKKDEKTAEPKADKK